MTHSFSNHDLPAPRRRRDRPTKMVSRLLRKPRLYLPLIALGLVASAVPSSAGHGLDPHWVKREAVLSVVVIDQTEGRFPIREAADRWSRSGVLDIRFSAGCPRGANCINVFLANSQTLGLTSSYATSDGRHLAFVDVALSSTRRMSASKRLSVACHELGHALALDHRGESDSCLVNGSSFPTRPDAHDYQELRGLYTHRH